jgi:hypothetical protein
MRKQTRRKIEKRETSEQETTKKDATEGIKGIRLQKTDLRKPSKKSGNLGTGRSNNEDKEPNGKYVKRK